MRAMARLRPTRIEHVVDGVRLRAQLSSAAFEWAGDAAGQRRAALAILRSALFRGRMIAKERLEAGAGGGSTARLLARVTDEVVGALYDFTTIHVFRARNPTQGERLAVMAVGGYGRGALAPFSDLDLLFLRAYKPTPHGESVIEFMLYALWDLGFKVGHASRTVEECLGLGREDFTIRTSLLEARRLVGDEGLAAELIARFRDEVARGTAAAFVAAKLAERDARHERAGASRYLVEPNVKESKGGLRDLNTLFWIAQYLHPAERPTEIVKLEVFTPRELKAFRRASDFLWAVRCHLHFAVGRAEERLSFDLQPEIARRMGYADSISREGREDATPGVERFMRRYFLIAREVGVLTRTFCAKLEAEHAKPPAQGLSRFLPHMLSGGRKPERRRLAPGFHNEGGRLDVENGEVFAKDRVNLLRLFALADRHDLDLHPDAFSLATRSLHLIDRELRADPAAAKLFLDILAQGRNPLRTLTLMNESGVLGRYIPEFGRVVGQMQFNMYHSFTVDEHTLRAVGVMAQAAAGELVEDPPLSTAVLPLIADREALFLAMLLHDTGKGGEDGQEAAGGRVARIVGKRLGLKPERVELVAWLIEHHLAMSDFAQKRDVSDPSTIAAFAALVENPERLRMLLAVTVADIRAVGPGVWNGWKAQLLRELHLATEAVFRGGRGDMAASLREAQAARAAEARTRLCMADVGSEEGVDFARCAWAGAMEDAYFSAFTPTEHLAHYALVRRAAAQGGAAAFAEPDHRGRATEVAVVARDRRGLFADLAGAFARCGASVAGARIYTSAEGEVLDVFHLCDGEGEPFGAGNPRALTRLVAVLEAAACGDPAAAEVAMEPVRLRRSSRIEAFSVSPAVTLDNAASDAATVIEVSGADRPGLLEALARTLADSGLSVASAHVESYGARAVDAFYVTDAQGGKLTDARRAATLKTTLSAVLAAPPAPSPRLTRARVSAAR